MQERKRSALVTVGLLLAGMASGCGPGSGESDADSGTSTEASTPFDATPEAVDAHRIPIDAAAGPSAYRDDPDILAILDAMDDNTAVQLEPYRLGGDRVDDWVRLNGSRAPHRRDYGNKIAYAPDRQTGMYAGMNHGVPHRLNDAWEYHLGSNTWYLLYFPEEMSPWVRVRPEGWYRDSVIIEDGYIQTRTRGPAYGVHIWDGLTYDPVLRRMLWANVSEGGFPMDRFAEETAESRESIEARLLPGTNLWMYDPLAHRWFRQMGDGPRPRLVMQGGGMEYVAHLQKTVWYACQWNESGMWLYDSASNEWEELAPNGGVSLYHTGEETFPRAEVQMRYSERHRRLVAVRSHFTYEYDFEANEWARVNEDPSNDAHDARTAFVYDSVNDVFLLLDPGDQSLRAYSTETKTWTTLEPEGTFDFPEKVAAYFDPAHNVMVVYDSTRSRMWLYRYRRA